MKRTLVAALVAGTVASIAPTASGQAYHQTFEVNSTATWTVNGGPSDEAANFFFDYSTVGIPAAPSAPGTRGMKLQANLTSGASGGFLIRPGLQLMFDASVLASV